MMVILHIACINNNLYNGVPVVVPQHLRAQQKRINAGLININNITIKGIENQFRYCTSKVVDDLPAPFCTPDLVLFHEVYYYEFINIARQLKKRGIPYIVIPHGALTHEAQAKKKIKKLTANLLLFKKFINEALAVQYLSEKESLESSFGKKKIISTNGISIPDEYKKTWPSAPIIRITYIGNLIIHIKGMDLMLKAIEECGDYLRNSKVEINLYGPNYKTRHDDVKKIISDYYIGDIVFVHDAVTGEEKKKILLNSDIFIQSSRSEGMPMGILEALSYGVPSLVTRGTNLGEIIEKYDAGWVAETTAESIADKLKQAVREKDKWEVKSQNARKLVEENFEWSKVAACAIEKYTHLIERR